MLVINLFSKYCYISKNEVLVRTTFPLGSIKNLEGISKTPYLLAIGEFKTN